MCICSKDAKSEKLGVSGNPYESGLIYRRCLTCGRVFTRSEDGTMWLSKRGFLSENPKNAAPAMWDYKPYLRTIADDMRTAGLNPDTATDEEIANFLGDNRY